jgi:hypothetical protein
MLFLSASVAGQVVVRVCHPILPPFAPGNITIPKFLAVVGLTIQMQRLETARDRLFAYVRLQRAKLPARLQTLIPEL